MKLLHASPGFGVQLTKNEIIEFLSHSKLNLHLGTIDVDNYPNIHPTWYLYDGSKDVIFVETGKQSKKTKNLKQNDKVYFCVDDGNPPYKGVRGKGNVKILSEPNANLPIAEKIMLKYLGSDPSSNGENITTECTRWKFSNARNQTSILLYLGL